MQENRHMPVIFLIYWAILSFCTLQTLSLCHYLPCKCRLCYHTGENICIDFWIHEGLLPLHGSCSSYSHTWVCKSKPWADAVRYGTDVTKSSFMLLSCICIGIVTPNHFHNCTYSNDIIYHRKAGSLEGGVATVSQYKAAWHNNSVQEMIAVAHLNFPESFRKD